ncbi:DUF885 domain-containing protein [Nakamurella endophytica]|uniref:DUF885 domain-containing protein n=1 Tax=Nakamurella endophytica TaxID=1748367 RepID=A0A917T304_9ACTN|nr:DUF885 domain-containing protein [Nakamurella endophytica]GGM09060.1 hypothetical protein GCM10011594_31220 [Nakamurella endophytica]
MTTPLHRLADELNTRLLRADPFGASEFGLQEYDALVPDASPEGEAELRADLGRIRDRVAELAGPGTDLSADEATLAAAIDAFAGGALLDLDIAAVEYTVTPHPWSGPATLVAIASRTKLADGDAAEAYLSRLRGSAGWIDAVTGRLRAGAANGLTPVSTLTANALTWVDAVLADPAPRALISPEPPAGWDGADGWRERLVAVATDTVRPALERWRDAVRDELLPVARDDDRAGLVWLPGGEQRYADAIRRHTTLPLAAQEIHEIGLEAVGRLEARAVELGAQLDLPDLDAVHAAFRAGTLTDAQEALGLVRAAVRRAEAVADRVVAPPLPPPCAVEPMPEPVASSGTAPHYTLPRTDGTRPGTYWFNTLLPTMGTGWDLEAVAFHEAVPGHHLQLARAQANTALPALLTQSLVTVHAEGWGLYTERLSGELGLYSDVRQEIGAVFAELHRAARLVVDTGIHALGWSREQARGYLLDHMPAPEPFLTSETDRYIAWPGQALAYMTGQREILRLRDVARDALGAGFDLPGFHGAVLDHGSLPLPALGVVVRRWVDEQRPAAG